jgi:hypothetical protein
MDEKQAKKVPTFFCLYLVINIQESIIYVWQFQKISICIM